MESGNSRSAANYMGEVLTNAVANVAVGQGYSVDITSWSGKEGETASHPRLIVQRGRGDYTGARGARVAGGDSEYRR